MRGIDSNVLLRFLTRDDKKQSERALELMLGFTAKDPAFITTIVITEVFWTLKRGYKYSRADITKALDPLLHLEEITFEHMEAVQYAFHLYRTGEADFADALLGRVGRLCGCETTHTFDEGALALVDFSEV